MITANSFRECSEKSFYGTAPHVIDHDLEPGFTGLLHKCIRELLRKHVKANSCVCAMFYGVCSGLLVASCSNHATRTEKLGYLGGQLARHARSAED